MKRVGTRRNVWQLIAALLVVLFAVAASGCFGSDENTPGKAKAAAELKPSKVSGKLSFWFLSDPAYDQKWWDRMVTAFQAKYKNVKVDVTKLETVPLKQKTIAAFASGTEPDVFFNSGGEDLFNLVRKGLVRPLDGYVDLDHYNSELIDTFRATDGKAYAVPVGFGAPFAMWFDKRVFDRLGIEKPKTWDELLSTCERLKADGIVPIALGNSELWPVVIWFDNLLYQYGGADIREQATFKKGGDVSWSDPAFVKAAEELKSLEDAGCFPKNFNGLTYNQQTDLWMRGDAGMTLLGEWAVTTVDQGAPKGFKLDYFLVPDAPDAKSSTASNEGMETIPTALSVSARTKNTDAVAAFLNFYGEYLTTEAQSSGRLSVAANPAAPKDPLQRRMLADAQSSGEFFIPTDALLPAALVGDLYQSLQELTLGDVSPQDFGERMAKAVDEKRDEFDADLKG